jgi:alkyl sulfatase BDS1-like metallo-beta-lactamase superfamily hydrolase
VIYRQINERIYLSILLAGALTACEVDPLVADTRPGSQGNSPATAITTNLNLTVRETLDIADQRDFEEATRGLIASEDGLIISMADGSIVWDMPSYDFITGEAPTSVNPSLWRQAKLNNIHGLFEVTEGIYQLRGFDISNMTIIEGERGWILVDPLTTRETAAAAIAFARKHLGTKPISTLIFTHSHIDHFGGVLSVLEADGSTEVIAPIGFMEEATSENVLVGGTMSRRAMLMYGTQLKRSPKGHVDTGLGKTPAVGSPGLTAPTRIIDSTGETMLIDGYRYIHDQTLRLASQGRTPGEIAEEIELPEALRASFPNRGYYGTLKHNCRAVYQRYFGWYDGNPANLDPLPPVEAAVRYVDTIGGANAVLTRAQQDFDKGDYRWVAELLNHLAFAEPDNSEAKQLLAKTYDQLGYQAESGPWRDNYQSAALELRHGAPSQGMGISNAEDLLWETPPKEFMQLISVMLNGPKAEGKTYVINFEFTGLGEAHTLQLENAVLYHRSGALSPDANATVRISHPLFVKMLTGNADIQEVLFSDDVSLEGSTIDLLGFFAQLDLPDDVFNIVTP